jgi:hypothetical protein
MHLKKKKKKKKVLPRSQVNLNMPPWTRKGSQQASTLNAYQLVLNKPNPRQREHKMHLNVCWPNTSHAREASPIVDQTHLMPAGTQYVFQLVLIKPILCQGINQMHLNMCWPNPSYASENIKFI